MYCGSCGSANPDFGNFCFRCGTALVRAVSRGKDTCEGFRQSPEHVDPVLELLEREVRYDRCHMCGGTHCIDSFEFAFARILSVQRDWSETIGRGTVSAITIALAPVTGFAGFSWKRPDKTVSYKLIKAHLVVCEVCLRQSENFWSGNPKLTDRHYKCHPWAAAMERLGFVTFLSADELTKLK